MNLSPDSANALLDLAAPSVIKIVPEPLAVGEPVAPPGPKKRILLADDDGGIRLMLGRVLKSEGYEVAVATSGGEAAARFIANPPHLVLLDLNMPGKDGWAAFDLMCEKHPLVPVIIITARPRQYDQASELGVDALMEKPLNLPLLLDTIKRLLAESEAECTRRLTNPKFKTLFLNSEGNDPPRGRPA